MSLRDQVDALAQLADLTALPQGEMRAQYLAATYRQLLLENTPSNLSQLHFLCILAATLGRFARDAAKPGESEKLGQLLAALMCRHAAVAPPIAES